MEKRQYQRVDNNFNVRVAKEIKEGYFQDIAIDIGKSVNISGGGLLFTANESIEKDSEIRVTFLKPNTFDFFEGKASVKRADKNDDGSFIIAVEFHDLNESEKDRLNYYINLCK